MSRASRAAERNALARIGYRLDRFLGVSAGVQGAAVLVLGILLGLAFGAAIWAFDGPAPPVDAASASQAGGNPSPTAHSLGAGGHLNGVDMTPTITRPPPKFASTSRSANAPATV